MILLWNLQKNLQLGDFALEPSENLQLGDFALESLTRFFSELTLLTSSTSNGCSLVIFCQIKIIHNFEGLLMKIKLLIVTNFASTGHSGF